MPETRNAAILGLGESPSTVPGSVLALRPGGLGDTLFCFPALRRLREAYPRARLVAAGRADFLDLARESGYVDEVRSLETLRFWSLLSKEVPLDPAAASFFGSFDLVLSWGYEGEVLKKRLEEAGTRAAFAFPFVPPEGSRTPVSRYILDTLRAVGIDGGDPVPRVFLRCAVEESARRELDSHARPPILALHPGSGGARKNWPADRFAEVAARFVGETAGTVLLLSGYADEKPRGDSLRALDPSDADLAGHFLEARDRPLAEVAALLENSSVYLGNDSGVTHLAAAVGVPVVALFGAEDRRFRPVGERVTVLKGAGLLSIPTARVWAEVRKLLSGRATSRPG